MNLHARPKPIDYAQRLARIGAGVPLPRERMSVTPVKVGDLLPVTCDACGNMSARVAEAKQWTCGTCGTTKRVVAELPQRAVREEGPDEP